ncbi:SCO4225 family membrane protein [Streptomyces sviceus]|uniref:SCO4225 family membrane protein n=1 Tax=Streptomyces sviceus TaxID=285530 RepID=UPI0036EB4D54
MNASRCFLNPLALGYLLVVAAVVGWVGVDALFVEHTDASLSLESGRSWSRPRPRCCS